MRIFVIIWLLAFVSSACNSQMAKSKDDKVKIFGKVNNTVDGNILIETVVNNQFSVIDTIELDESQEFSIGLEVTEPNLYRLNFYNRQIAFLILNPMDTEVKVVADGTQPDGELKITGSKDTDYLKEIQDIKKGFQTFAQEINDEGIAAQEAGDTEKINALRDKYQEELQQIDVRIKDKIREMGNSLTAILVLQELDINTDFEFFDEIAQKFKESLPGSKYTQNLVSIVDEMRKVSVGQVAPDIELSDPEGNLVSLSSLRGNYVMIDFWAAWCKPCRAENPNVVALYKKYNKKGFEVFGVSLDRKKEDWIRAIEADGLEWTHVSDLKYFQSEAAQLYNVQAIPATFLIDKQGKIIAKNLRGEALKKRLEELFDGV